MALTCGAHNVIHLHPHGTNMCSGARRPPPPTPSLPIHGPSSARTRPPARDGAEGDVVLALALASADRRRSCAGAQASAASPHRVHKAPPRRALHEAPPRRALHKAAPRRTRRRQAGLPDLAAPPR